MIRNDEYERLYRRLADNLAGLGCAAHSVIIFIAVGLVLTACASPEEKAIARMNKWAEACQSQTGYAYQACVANLESSYQADRSRNVARGAALLGYGAAVSAPPAGSASMNCTTLQTGGMHPSWTTNCR